MLRLIFNSTTGICAAFGFFYSLFTCFGEDEPLYLKAIIGSMGCMMGGRVFTVVLQLCGGENVSRMNLGYPFLCPADHGQERKYPHNSFRLRTWLRPFGKCLLRDRFKHNSYDCVGAGTKFRRRPDALRMWCTGWIWHDLYQEIQEIFLAELVRVVDIGNHLPRYVQCTDMDPYLLAGTAPECWCIWSPDSVAHQK